MKKKERIASLEYYSAKLEQRVADLECNLSHHTHSVSRNGFTGRPWFSPLKEDE